MAVGGTFGFFPENTGPKKKPWVNSSPTVLRILKNLILFALIKQRIALYFIFRRNLISGKPETNGFQPGEGKILRCKLTMFESGLCDYFLAKYVIHNVPVQRRTTGLRWEFLMEFLTSQLCSSSFISLFFIS